jgi:tripartite-type tricarboxylate transporter receptor subunit TctC
MKKILLISLVVLLAVTTGVYAAGKDFPKRNITVVVVWGAGG